MILEGFRNLLTWGHIATLFIGTAAGTVFGAIPGLSALTAIALLLPFTFAMEPTQGLIMLAAVWTSAQYSGSIPAILINTPGTTGAAATTLDGYPMALKGEAQEALYLQLFAGCIGGLFAGGVLLFFTPTMARISLMMGPAEFLWLAVAALCLVARLGGRSVTKGLIGAAIGVFLTVPGQDSITGEIRFTFDIQAALVGIPLAPALIGVFAVSTILELLGSTSTHLAPLSPQPGVIRYVLRRMSRMKILLAWTSIIGTFVGMLPGAGASMAAFVAYGESKRISKNSREFGKGAWEGVAGPEAANNAVVGGAMVPLLGLGIPGSAAVAVMFGALTVHGIVAGPSLFTERADIAYTFMIGVIAAVPAMLIFGLATIRWSSLAVKAPLHYLVASVLGMAVLGTYSLRGSVYDVGVLVSMGILGYLLSRAGITPVTIALGFVLGRLIEQNIQRTSILAGAARETIWRHYLSRPIAVFFIVVAILLLASGLVATIREGKENPSSDDEVKSNLEDKRR